MTPPAETAPTATSAITPRRDSTSIAPYEMGSMSDSFSTCLEAVSEDTSEWKPETAPHATVTKRIGKREPADVMNPENAGRSIGGLDAKIPTTAAAIIAMRR